VPVRQIRLSFRPARLGILTTARLPTHTKIFLLARPKSYDARQKLFSEFGQILIMVWFYQWSHFDKIRYTNFFTELNFLSGLAGLS
jgi:hypothetical protein